MSWLPDMLHCYKIVVWWRDSKIPCYRPC